MCRCFAYQAGLALRFTAALPSPCLQAMRRCCPISQKSFKAQTKPGHSAGQSLCCAQAKKRLSVKAKQAYQRVAAPARLRFFNPPPHVMPIQKYRHNMQLSTLVWCPTGKAYTKISARS